MRPITRRRQPANRARASGRTARLGSNSEAAGAERLFVAVALVLATAAVAAVVGRPAASSPAATGRTFTDARGDSPCSHDITSVRASNDDAGIVRFDIAARPAGGECGEYDDLGIGIDSDRRTVTGAEGIDYLVIAYVGPRGATGVNLLRWSGPLPIGARFVELGPRGVRVSVDGDGGRVRVVLDRNRLGNTEGLAFQVSFGHAAVGSSFVDIAPDQGTWTVPVRINLTRIRPKLSVTTTASRAGGARLAIARLALRVRGTRGLLASGRISCVASLARRRLELASSAFVERRARCAWRLPDDVAGKTLRGAVTVRVQHGRRGIVRVPFRREFSDALPA